MKNCVKKISVSFEKFAVLNNLQCSTSCSIKGLWSASGKPAVPPSANSRMLMTLAPSCRSAFRRNRLHSVQQLVVALACVGFVHVAVQNHIIRILRIQTNYIYPHLNTTRERDSPVPVKDTGSQYCAVLAPEDSDNDWRHFAHFLQWKQNWLEEMEQNERRLQDQQNAKIIFQNDGPKTERKNYRTLQRSRRR